jgi:NADH-quinone oxidoreductase subunit G
MDLESLSILKKFLALNGSNYFLTKQENSIDNQSFYSFNTSMLDLVKSDICLLFDVNLRIQLPVLNSKIRQVSLKNNLVVYLIGYYANFNYYVKHVSTTSSTLLNILEGSY